jgi:hypothetical protein
VEIKLSSSDKVLESYISNLNERKVNLKKAKLDVKVVLTLFVCFLTDCTFVYKPEIKYDENQAIKKPVSFDSILSNPGKYSAYESKYTDLLKEKYFESMAMARQEYIKVVSRAEELGIKESPYLDTCCNHIRKIDSLLTENSMVKYCDSINKDSF